jgi:hypothetical protein
VSSATATFTLTVNAPSIAMPMRHSQVHQLNPVLAVVESQVFRKENGGWLELTAS